MVSPGCGRGYAGADMMRHQLNKEKKKRLRKVVGENEKQSIFKAM